MSKKTCPNCGDQRDSKTFVGRLCSECNTYRLDTHEVACASGCGETVMVQVAPGGKIPRRICDTCKEKGVPLHRGLPDTPELSLPKIPPVDPGFIWRRGEPSFHYREQIILGQRKEIHGTH